VSRRSAAEGTTRPELLRALGRLADPAPDHQLCELLGLPAPPPAHVHTEVFLLQSHPYASVHLGADGLMGGEAGARVADFWRTLGFEPPTGADRLSPLLTLYADLGEEELRSDGHRRRALASARGALAWEHLVPWVPTYLGVVVRLGDPFYGAWARLLLEALEVELSTLPERADLPRALAASPPPCDAGTRTALLESLLAPARSGIVVTRADLVEAGRDLGLAVRLGERRYTLGGLLDQDAPATLRWLGRLAAGWGEYHQGLATGPLAPVARWWASRARHTAGALTTAPATDAEGSMAGSSA